jgi:hypothetical protein
MSKATIGRVARRPEVESKRSAAVASTEFRGPVVFPLGQELGARWLESKRGLKAGTLVSDTE